MAISVSYNATLNAITIDCSLDLKNVSFEGSVARAGTHTGTHTGTRSIDGRTRVGTCTRAHAHAAVDIPEGDIG